MHCARRGFRVQAPDCGAPAGRSDLAAGLILLSLAAAARLPRCARAWQRRRQAKESRQVRDGGVTQSHPDIAISLDLFCLLTRTDSPTGKLGLREQIDRIERVIFTIFERRVRQNRLHPYIHVYIGMISYDAHCAVTFALRIAKFRASSHFLIIAVGCLLSL